MSRRCGCSFSLPTSPQLLEPSQKAQQAEQVHRECRTERESLFLRVTSLASLSRWLEGRKRVPNLKIYRKEWISRWNLNPKVSNQFYYSFSIRWQPGRDEKVVGGAEMVL